MSQITWGEFKKQMEQAGAKDEDEIGYFDFSGSGYADCEQIHASKNEYGAWEVTC